MLYSRLYSEDSTGKRDVFVSSPLVHMSSKMEAVFFCTENQREDQFTEQSNRFNISYNSRQMIFKSTKATKINDTVQPMQSLYCQFHNYLFFCKIKENFTKERKTKERKISIEISLDYKNL